MADDRDSFASRGKSISSRCHERRWFHRLATHDTCKPNERALLPAAFSILRKFVSLCSLARWRLFTSGDWEPIHRQHKPSNTGDGFEAGARDKLAEGTEEMQVSGPLRAAFVELRTGTVAGFAIPVPLQRIRGARAEKLAATGRK
eukprot:2460584-Rhodomonas_salina.4